MPDPTPSPAPAPAPAPVPSPTPEPITQPYYRGWLHEDGSLDATSYDRLPEHLKPFKDFFAQSKNIDELLARAGNLNQLAGKKGLEPLPDSAPEALKVERAALIKRALGVPDDPKGYGIAAPTELPAGVQWDEAYANDMVSLMHRHNAPPQMVRELVAKQIEFQKAQAAQQAQYETQFFADQDKAWAEGVRLQNMPASKADDLAKRAALQLGIDPDNNPVFRNAAVKLALLKASQMLGEDKLVTGDDTQQGGPGDDRAKALDIKRNPANPLHKAYNDPLDPGHSAAIATVDGLYAAWGAKMAKLRKT